MAIGGHRDEGISTIVSACPDQTSRRDSLHLYNLQPIMLMEWLIPTDVKVPIGLYLAATGTATLLVGISKGGFGGGIGVLATPLFLMVLPANVALSMMLPILIVCDAFTLRQFPRTWDPRSFRMIAGGTVIGLGFGLFLLLYFARESVDGDRWIRLIVAAVSILFCILQAWKAWRHGQAPAYQPGWIVGTLTGIMCGITTMVAHAAGVIVNMFLLTRHLDPQHFVGTCARYYLTFNTLKVPLYLLSSVLADKPYITFTTLKWDLWLLPFCPLGVALGAWLNRRMSSRLFTLVIYLFLAITAGKMIRDSL